MCMHFGSTHCLKSSNILNEYNIDPSKLAATTDHGANVVAVFRISGLDASARLDCMAHRLLTCFSSMWSQACSSLPELQDYENNASALARYCNQASGVQEQLPVSIKKGSTARRWEGLIDRAHSINESYDALMHILSEQHRDRALLVASVNRRLKTAISKFMIPLRKLFEVLQFKSKPTINFAVLVYYEAVELTKPCPNSDDPAIAKLKKEFRLLLDKVYLQTR